MVARRAALNQRVAELLAPAPHDRLLEVGFGPGTTLAHLARLVPAGRAVGVDPSTVMLRQAAPRNRAAIDAGRLELHVAAAEHLPFDDCCFDKALALHTLGHWSAPEQGLREVHRVLKPGGALVIGLRGKQPSETIEAMLAGVGFGIGRPATSPRERHASTLLLARRPGTGDRQGRAGG